MRVMITGGTGFVGSHTVAELVRDGHAVRMLVRAPQRVRPVLELLGVKDVDLAIGDVTDPVSVERAMEGCDATVHCAAVTSWDVRMGAAIRNTNVPGTNVVLGIAHRLGLDPIVHVSGFAALIGTKGGVLTPDSSTTSPPGAYYRSKAESDRVARGYQNVGAPVVIIYPGGVFGPHDTRFGDGTQIVENILRGHWRVAPAGGIPVTDVRDLAKLHAAVLEKGRGPRRYIATAQDVTVQGAFEIFSRLTGRNLSTIILPLWTLYGPALLSDALQRLLPFRLPISSQAVYAGGVHPRLDDGATRREFGIQPRSVDETFTDSIRWLVQSGRIPPGLAGRLAT